MILFFSGTGNSRSAASLLGDRLSESVAELTHIAPSQFKSSGERLIFCFPAYSWGVPPIVLDFIDRLPEQTVIDLRLSDTPIYMVATCGDEVARAPEMFARRLRRRSLSLRGACSVTMPNNYVLLPGFDVDDAPTEARKLAEAPARIDSIAEAIAAGRREIDVVRGSWPRLKTTLVYPLFRKYGIRPSLWRASELCIGCGKCRDACPAGNIALDCSSRPVWGPNCLSCTACYHICPRKAIAYGNITKSKGQYHFRN